MLEEDTIEPPLEYHILPSPLALWITDPCHVVTESHSALPNVSRKFKPSQCTVLFTLYDRYQCSVSH